MLEIFNTPEILNKRNELKENFEVFKNDALFLGDADSINEIDEWKYSTGPIFDQPPYTSEISGSNGGKLLKKKYASPYEARLKGAYCSGFINGTHKITIDPIKPESMPLTITQFDLENDALKSKTIRYYNHRDCASPKKPELIGISIFYPIRENIRAYIGVSGKKKFDD